MPSRRDVYRRYNKSKKLTVNAQIRIPINYNYNKIKLQKYIKEGEYSI